MNQSRPSAPKVTSGRTTSHVIQPSVHGNINSNLAGHNTNSGRSPSPGMIHPPEHRHINTHRSSVHPSSKPAQKVQTASTARLPPSSDRRESFCSPVTLGLQSNNFSFGSLDSTIVSAMTRPKNATDVFFTPLGRTLSVTSKLEAYPVSTDEKFRQSNIEVPSSTVGNAENLVSDSPQEVEVKPSQLVKSSDKDAPGIHNAANATQDHLTMPMTTGGLKWPEYQPDPANSGGSGVTPLKLANTVKEDADCRSIQGSFPTRSGATTATMASPYEDKKKYSLSEPVNHLSTIVPSEHNLPVRDTARINSIRHSLGSPESSTATPNGEVTVNDPDPSQLLKAGTSQRMSITTSQDKQLPTLLHRGTSSLGSVTGSTPQSTHFYCSNSKTNITLGNDIFSSARGSSSLHSDFKSSIRLSPPPITKEGLPTSAASPRSLAPIQNTDGDAEKDAPVEVPRVLPTKPEVKRVVKPTHWVTPEEATADIVRLCVRRYYDPVSIYTCVQEGAFVTQKSSEMDRPLLHHFVVDGHVKCLEACLKSPSPIDFTLRDGVNGCNPLHLACQVGNKEMSKTILRMIVERLARCPDDKVDWGQLNDRGRDFIAWAAVFQDLASTWEVIQDVPYFAKRPIPISSRPMKSNWDTLGEDQKHFVLLNGIQPDKSTLKLVRLCMNPPPKPEQVKGFVEEGGDVMFQGEEMERPILHQLILDGQVDCVEACMQTKGRIDFNLRDKHQFSPLHCVCLCRDPEKAETMMRLMKQRMVARTDDGAADWTGETGGQDFLTCAAENMKLAKLFPVVRDAAYFPTAEKEPFPLRASLDRYDYDVLGNDVKCFDFQEGLLDDTIALANLCRQPNPNPAAVQMFVDEGADVTYEGPEMDRPILHHLVRAGHVDCVAACLSSTRRINFTVQDRNKYTVAHTVFRCPTVELGEDMLKLLVQRLNTHPLDKVDWTIKDKLNHDFFAWAVKCKKSSPVYQFMKRSPYFRRVKRELKHDRQDTLLGHMDNRLL